MYGFDSRVRYSETDEEGILSIEGMMNYLQDCSTFQSEDIGVGLSYMRGKKAAWWVYNWNIEIIRMPKLGDMIRIETWPHGFRGIFGYRNFVIRDAKGEILVQADSAWFYYDLESMTPSRPPKEDIDAYGSEERLAMSQVPRRMSIPEGGTELSAVTVTRHHLDTNHHVNNAQYIEIARECLPEKTKIRRIWAEYRKAAVLGDVMVPYRVPSEAGDAEIISLRDPEGQVYASVYLYLDE